MVRKIMEKPELKELPLEDIEMALSLCFKKQNSDEENIERTREVLHKAYGAFGSRKLFTSKEKEPEWILRKHMSTRERLLHYREIYKKILKNKKWTILDLGAGVNGFSMGFIPKQKYIGIEGIGQLVTLMNIYFKKQKYNARAIHLSLFELEKLKTLITKEKGQKIAFLFKTLDSLEILKRDYSKQLLKEITPLVDRVAVSFATRSMIKRKRFNVNRKWILDFIKGNFIVVDDFEIAGERYVVFKER